MPLNKANWLWEQGDVLLKSIQGLRMDVERISDSRLEFSKRAVGSSLLDLEDQLEHQMFRLLRKWYHRRNKYGLNMSEKSAKLIERANEALNDVAKTYNHVTEALEKRIKALRGDLHTKTFLFSKHVIAQLVLHFEVK